MNQKYQLSASTEVSSSQETNELADLEFSFDLAPLHETENKTQARGKSRSRVASMH